MTSQLSHPRDHRAATNGLLGELAPGSVQDTPEVFCLLNRSTNRSVTFFILSMMTMMIATASSKYHNDARGFLLVGSVRSHGSHRSLRSHGSLFSQETHET